MKQPQDLTGNKYGRLTVLGIADRCNSGMIRYKCICECGKETYVIGRNLKNGHTKSCGCLHKDIITKHGKTNSRLFRIWSGMLNRCNCVNSKDYKNYGKRGIGVCKEWEDDFMSFFNWSIVNGYADNLTIDRIDNNGDYAPSNCRWATVTQQSNNKRSNRFILFDGKNMTLEQWSEKTGISRHALQKRLDCYGWSIEEALTTPTKKHKISKGDE